MRDPERGAMELSIGANDRAEQPGEVKLTNNWRQVIGDVMAVIKSVRGLASTMIGRYFYTGRWAQGSSQSFGWSAGETLR